MFYYFPGKHQEPQEGKSDAVEKAVEEGKVAVVWEKKSDAKPADWPYMEMSGKVLRDPPKTWAAYPDTIDGLWSIIDMEFRELQNSRNYSKQDIMRELVHLGSATLALWRKYAAE